MSTKDEVEQAAKDYFGGNMSVSARVAFEAGAEWGINQGKLERADLMSTIVNNDFRQHAELCRLIEVLEIALPTLPSYLGMSETKEYPCARRIVEEALAKLKKENLMLEMRGIKR